MKFDVPKVIRPLALKEYAAEFGETALQVWINPDKAVRKERLDLQEEYRHKSQAEILGYLKQVQAAKKKGKPEPQIPDPTEQVWFMDWKRRWVDWVSRIWSQGTEESHMISAEILELESTDPHLVRWLVDQTLDMIDDLKKALPPA